MIRMCLMPWLLSVVIAASIASPPAGNNTDANKALGEKIALEAWASFVESRENSVEVGDPCPNCGGKGTVGDGRQVKKCIPCRGSGKVLSTEMSMLMGSMPDDIDAKIEAIRSEINEGFKRIEARIEAVKPPVQSEKPVEKPSEKPAEKPIENPPQETASADFKLYVGYRDNCGECDKLKAETLPAFKDNPSWQIIEIKCPDDKNAPYVRIEGNGKRLQHEGFLTVAEITKAVN